VTTILAPAQVGNQKLYDASPLKRRRATKREMQERAEFLVAYAQQHGPITVRGLYYQAEVHKLPGIDKAESGYGKVQRQVLDLRRAGRLDYEHVANATRWMRKPRSYNSVEDALLHTAHTDRQNLWRDAGSYVETWVEKGALAGVIYPVTSEYDAPLMVARGFSSETFAYEAVAARDNDARDYHVYYLGDFDRSGLDAARSLEEKLQCFACELPNCICTIVFHQIAITKEQIESFRLPTRPPKRNRPADKAWPHDFACELDAIPPDELRGLVRRCIERHLPRHQLEIARVAEESERKLARRLVRNALDGDAERMAP
jgi:hypothetical protein